jgi:hypothetical protein
MLPGFRARGRHPCLTVRSQTTDGRSHLRIGRHKRTCELVSLPKLNGAPFSERAFSWPARVQPVAVCDLSPSVQSGASFCEASLRATAHRGDILQIVEGAGWQPQLFVGAFFFRQSNVRQTPGGARPTLCGVLTRQDRTFRKQWSNLLTRRPRIGP